MAASPAGRPSIRDSCNISANELVDQDTGIARLIVPSRLEPRHKVLAALLVAVIGARLTEALWRPLFVRTRPVDPVPAVSGSGSLQRRGPYLVLRVAGTPEEMGRQHGTLLRRTIRFMLANYTALRGGRGHMGYLLAVVRRMRAVLPDALAREIDACAKAAGVDPDMLLLAQCVGDVGSAVRAFRYGPAAGGDGSHACTSYVAFGAATRNGRLEFGRNFEYSFDVDCAVAKCCSLVTYQQPAEGYAFMSVGIAGVCTGWTVVNEKGLVVANHLGGGTNVSPDAVPTLLLARLVAQHAATVDEGIEILKRTPRMRGQIIWLAQDADPGTDRPARAVAVEFDAEELAARQARNGVLVVTNTNLLLGGETPEEEADSRYRFLRGLVNARYGELSGGEWLAVHALQGSVPQHAVQGVPSAGVLSVRLYLGWRLEPAVAFPCP